MKRFVKRVFIVLAVLAAVVDWPVTTEAVPKFSSIAKGLKKSTAKMEKSLAEMNERMAGRNGNIPAHPQRAAEPIAAESAPASGLFSSCSNTTRQAERSVNMATQRMERNVNRAVGNPNVRRAAAYGTMRASHAYGRNRQGYSSAICPMCHGRSYVIGRNGYRYTCPNCRGAGG